MRTQRFAAAIALIAICGLISCTDGPSPVSPGNSGIARLALAPSYSISGYFQTLPINRIRLTAFVAGTTTPLPPTPDTFTVSPDAESWSLPVEFELPSEQQVQIEVLIELVNVSPTGVETVEFSGLTAPLQVTSGNNQNVATVTVHPGPPENLDVNAVVITSSVGNAIEGDVLNLDASVDGPAGAVVTWGTLDPTRVQIQTDGDRSANITTLLPGPARIIAVAGPRSDTVTLQITQRPSSVSIQPGDVSLNALDAVAEFSAQVLDPRGDPIAGAGIAWEIEDEAIATHLGNGRFRAESSGSTEITARAAGTPALLATVELTVAQEAAAINLSKTALSLRALGAEATIEAEAEDENGNPIAGSEFDWSTSDDDVVTVDDAGNLVAIGVGSAVVTASLDGISEDVDVTVEQVPVDVVVTPAEIVLTAIGTSAQLQAVAADSLGNVIEDADVTWSSTNQEAVEVSADGEATAVGNGTATIIATVADASGEATVSVEQEAASVSVAPETVSFTAIGETSQLTATARDASDAEIQDPPFTWTSSDETVVTVTEAGLVTAAGNGTATVTASSGGAEGTATFTVQQVPASLGISYELGAGDTPEALTAGALGGMHAFTAVVADGNGNAITGSPITWSSTGTAVADVDASGVVTIKGNGNAYIIASSGEIRDSVLVSVQQVAATIEVEPTAVTFDAVGETRQLSAIVRDANAAIMLNAAIDWVSSNPDAVSVSTTGMLTALAQGTATITATSGDATTDIIANVESVIGDVVITPPSATLTFIGQSLQLAAEVLDQNGVGMTADVVWSVIESGIVSVDPQDGEIVALANGTARVVATAGTVADTAEITVAQTATRIEIVPVDDDGWIDESHADIDALGDTATLTAIVYDADDNVVEDAVVTWTTSNDDVLHLTAAGFATVVGNGTAIVRAVSGGARDSVFVSVHQEPAEIVVNPENLAFDAPGDTARVIAEARDANDNLIHDYAPEWHTTNPGVAGVDNGLVTAIGNGTAWIKALGTNGTGDSTFVTVNFGAASVTLSVDSIRFEAFLDDEILEAVIRDGNGQIIEAPLTWTSSDTTVAVVDQSGRVGSRGNGLAVIRVAAGDARDSALVRVQQVPHSITVPPVIIFEVLNDSVRIDVDVFDFGESVIEDAEITFSSTDSLVARVSADGVVRPVSGGLAGILVSSGSVSMSISTLVLQPDSFTFTSIGQSMDLPAEVPGVNGPIATVEWTSGNIEVVQIDLEPLEATAVGLGSTEVTGEFVYNDHAYSQVWHVTVLQTPARINIIGDTSSLNSLGETYDLPYEVTDSLGNEIPNAELTWFSSIDAIATVDDGLVTAVAQGFATIHAFSGPAIDSIVIEVRQLGDSIWTNVADSVVMNVGDSVFVSTQAFDFLKNPIPNAAFVWNTNANDSSIVVAHQDGWLEGVGPGRILVNVGVDGATRTFPVRVIQTAASIEVEPLVIFEQLGDGVQLEPTVRDENHNVIADPDLEWSTTDSLVAVVSETGLVTPVGPGVSAIGLTSGAASTSITALVLEPDSLTFTSLGVRHQLLAEVPGANGPLAQITWTSADESIVNIDDENQKAISESVGTTQVTGQFIYNDQTYSQLLHVTVQQIPVFFDIHEDTLELTAIGETLEIGIETRDSAGSMLDDLDIIDWVSSDPGVATADTQIVTAVSGGFTTVYAVYGDVIDSVVVHVDQWTETITVSPDSVHFTATGDTLTVAAQAFDYLEHLIPNAPIEWTTSDSSVVIAHPEGLLEATGAGAAQVTATLDDGLAVVQVVVSPEAASIEMPSWHLFTRLTQSMGLEVVARDADGNAIGDAEIELVSSNPEVATVNVDRIVAPVDSGRAHVIATIGDVVDTMTVYVFPVEEVEGNLSFTALDQTFQLPSSLGVYEASAGTFNWSSRNTEVVFVSENVATAMGNGQTFLDFTFTFQDGSEYADSLAVVVEQQAAAVDLGLEDGVDNTFRSLTEQKVLDPRVSDAEDNDISSFDLIWTSSDETVATVDDSGLVTAVANGDVTITATYSGPAVAGVQIDQSQGGPDASGYSMPPEVSGSIALTVSQVARHVNISQDSVGLTAIGDTATLDVTVTDSLNQVMQTEFGIDWAVDSSAIATVEGGFVTAVHNGSTWARVFAGSDVDSAKVTVHQVAASLSLDRSFHEFSGIGDTTTATATVRDANQNPMSDASVIWTSSDPEIVIANSGGFLVASGFGPATVTATIVTQGESLSATMEVEVLQIVTDLQIDNDGSNTFASLTETKQLGTTALDSNSDEIDVPVIWSTSDPSVAVVSQSGLVTSVGNGDVIISAVVEDETNSTNLTFTGNGPASSTESGYLQSDPPSASVALTVYQVPASVEIDVDSVQMRALHRTHDFNVTSVRDALGQPLERSFFVNWSSENESRVTIGAPCDTCSQGHARGLANGKTKVIAEVEGAADTALVHVKQVPGHLRITTRGVNIHALTHSRHFQAEVLDPDSFPLEPQPELTWLSDDESTAEVDESGQVTARGNGHAKIRARISTDDGILEDTATVGVQQVAARLRLNNGHKSVNFHAFGRGKQLTAVLKDSADVEMDEQPGMSWRSSDETRVTVDENGNVQNKEKNGNSRIFVEFDTGDGVIADTADIVTEQVPGRVRIKSNSRGPRFRTLGRKVRMEAEVEDSAGFTLETQPTVEWTSDNEDDAGFEDGDLLVAHGNGNTIVRARYSQDGILVEDTTNVDIEQYGAKVKVKPESRGLSMRALNAQRRLEAEVQDSAGNPLDQAGQDSLQAQIGWTSATDSVEVDDEGNVTAKKNGRSKLTVTFNGESDTVTVAVRQVGTKITFPDQLQPGTLHKRYRLNAVVKDELDNVVEIPVDEDWTSEDEGILEVSGDTAVFSRGNGPGRLILHVDEAVDTLEVPVRQVVHGLRMNRDTATLTAFDDEVQLTPIAEDSTGFAVGDAEFTWSTSDTSAASVDGTGKVKAKKNAAVIATAHLDDSEIPTDLEDLTFDATVTVSQRPASFVPDTSALVDKQHGRPGQQLTEPLKVMALDANGFPMEQGTVQWSPRNGGSVDVSTETLTPAKGGKSSSKWTVRNLGNADTLTVSVTVADSAIVYNFTATIDTTSPGAVLFARPTSNQILSPDTVTIVGTATDDKSVDKVECSISSSGFQFGGTVTQSFPKNAQSTTQVFSCAFTAQGLGLPVGVPLTATVKVYDKTGRDPSTSSVIFQFLFPS